ncbi:hypothetical protein D3C73_1424150 [compost metagenome]
MVSNLTGSETGDIFSSFAYVNEAIADKIERDNADRIIRLVIQGPQVANSG